MLIRSFYCALTGTLSVALLALFVLFGLNERFVDSATLGWLVFLGLPLLLAVPATLITLAAGALAPGRPRVHGAVSLTLILGLFVLPVTLFLMRDALAEFLLGSPGLTNLLTGVAAVLLLTGLYGLTRVLSRALIDDESGRGRWAVPVAFALVIAIACPIGGFLSSRPLALDKDKPVTVIFGADGVSWERIDELTEKGELPAWKQLQEEGARIDMESIEPLMSPILWTTIASGMGADKHGVHTFYASSASVEVPRIWDVVEQNGGRAGLLGWPVTWPPRPIDGFMIPSLFARGPETYPPELSFVRELAMREKGRRTRDMRSYAIYGIRCVQYGVKLSTLVQAVEVLRGTDDYLASLSPRRFLKLKIHGDIFLELWERERPDFVTFYNNVPDVTSHYFWKYFEPEAFPEVTPEEAKRFGDAIPEAYRQYDSVMGNILRYVPEHVNIVVLSDHGLRATATQTDGTIRIIRTETFLDRFGIADVIQGINLASRVYLRPSAGKGTIPTAFATMLDDLAIDETGDRLFQISEDDWGNVIVDVRRDVDVAGFHVTLPSGESIPIDDFVEETHAKVSGVHHPRATLLVRGEKIRRGVRDLDATILDVAPTVLYLMGYP
ncbi:MAG: hypothetical protein HKN20_02495, partial [Gemmatimonadetes bacterium]|nr:hypothetical protein [Gemmatimonadota bacterium]